MDKIFLSHSSNDKTMLGLFLIILAKTVVYSMK